MLYHKKPIAYISEMEVVWCVIEHEWEILLVKRCSNHTFWDTWSEPGWKVDPGETNEQAMIREIFEESWIIIKKWEADLLFRKYFRFDGTNITISFYHRILDIRPRITLSPREHSDYVWVTPEKALNMNLIEDFDTVLKEIYNI